MNYQVDDGSAVQSVNYEIPAENSHYRYNVNNFDYEWKSLPDSHIVELSDDTINMKEIGFKFYYYGEEYESLTICSNGWVSFEPCLKHPDENNYQNFEYHYTYGIEIYQ